MSSSAGVWKIVRFNWPWYAAAGLVTVLLLCVLTAGCLLPPWSLLALTLLGLADLWLLLSLVVSHAIYDRSDVARGEWLGTAPATVVAVFHFGQDEASSLVARRLPAARRQTFDLYEPQRTGSPSLRRARALARHDPAVTSAAFDALPLADGSLDLGVLAFAAHEVRDEVTRVILFRELRRTLACSGRLLVVEHLRDGWNFAAYGPGMLHFLSRRTWLRTFARAGLQVAAESRLTPWVRRFELQRAP